MSPRNRESRDYSPWINAIHARSATLSRSRKTFVTAIIARCIARPCAVCEKVASQAYIRWKQPLVIALKHYLRCSSGSSGMKRLKLCLVTSWFCRNERQSRSYVLPVRRKCAPGRPGEISHAARDHLSARLSASVSWLRDIVLDTSRLLRQASKAVHVFRTPSRGRARRAEPLSLSLSVADAASVRGKEPKQEGERKREEKTRDKRAIISATANNRGTSLAHHRARKIDRETLYIVTVRPPWAGAW